MRWRRRRPAEGRLPSLGQDYGEAHRRYVERLGESAEFWLRTKPFSAPPRGELLECFRTFAHIVDRLGLGLRAQVLDVGCGPGWLSEFLARCGYWVTGVDVSEDMVRIARERIAAIEEPIGEGIEAIAEFHAMPVLELPWTERFDAAILYDAMHHFDDEVETLRVIRGTLVPGGWIFIHEGVRPTAGSEGERQLIAEMEEYGTLESPFDPEYLVASVKEAGFTEVTRLAAVDELLDVSAREQELERVDARLKNPPMNTVLALSPSSVDAEPFAAHIEMRAPGVPSNGGGLSVPISVTNTGRSFWPDRLGDSLPAGVVTVGPYVPLEDGGRLELPRQTLPHSLSPGESVDVDVSVVAQGSNEVRIDLVHEGIAWFADYGSTPLVVPLG